MTLFTLLQIVDVKVMTVMKVIDSVRVTLDSLVVQLLQKPAKVSIFFIRANNIGFGRKGLKIDLKGIEILSKYVCFFVKSLIL